MNKDTHPFKDGGSCGVPSIREIRSSVGLSQSAFSEALGIPKRTLEDWESGRRRPPEYVLSLISFFIDHGGLAVES